MNKRQAKNRVIDLVNDKGSISAPGRFASHIFNELNVGNGASSQVKNNIMAAIEDLGAAGKIEVERSGKVIVGIAPVKQPRIVEPGAEARRQRLHATDALGRQLPSRLPDSMCTPVVVRKIGDPVPKEQEVTAVSEAPQSEIMTIPYHKKELFHETLTAALKVLRAEANDEGVGVGLSVMMVLQCAGLTESQSDRVLEFLRALKLYSTKMTAYQKSDYYVELLPEVITDDMVVEARALIRSTGPKKAAAESGSHEDVLERMADIIEGLEAQLAESDKEKNSLKSQLVRAEAKIRTRDNKITRAEAKAAADRLRIQELEAEVEALNQRQALTASSRVSNVLDRYTK